LLLELFGFCVSFLIVRAKQVQFIFVLFNLLGGGRSGLCGGSSSLGGRGRGGNGTREASKVRLFPFNKIAYALASSSVYEPMCLYHRDAWGNLPEAGALLIWLKTAKSALEAENLHACLVKQQKRRVITRQRLGYHKFFKVIAALINTDVKSLII
jgi:hypothetical protein